MAPTHEPNNPPTNGLVRERTQYGRIPDKKGLLAEAGFDVSSGLDVP